MGANTEMILFLISGIILLMALLLVLFELHFVYHVFELHFVYHDMVDGLLYNILVQGPAGILGGLSILSFLEAYNRKRAKR